MHLEDPFIAEVEQAKKAKIPLLLVTTLDQLNTVKNLQKWLEVDKADSERSFYTWDSIRGYTNYNEYSKANFKRIIGKKDPSVFANLVEALFLIEKIEDYTVIVFYNMHSYMHDPAPIQALTNIRDKLKSKKMILILLGPQFEVPIELSQYTLLIDEPLPSDHEVKSLLTDISSLESGKNLEGATDAARGLSFYMIEQLAHLSLEDGRFNLDRMWKGKRTLVSQVSGLSMESPKETFEDIGGLHQAKQFMERLFSGPRQPRIICFLDEMEKMFGGAGTITGVGDTSGVSQDILGVLLSNMEDYRYSGMIALGPAGSGKSMFAKAAAATNKIPLIKVDLGATKGSLVGQSERQIRIAMKTILTVAGIGGAFFISTVNKIDVLPPELRRRFRFGLWMFALPDKEERIAIGKLQTNSYKMEEDKLFWSKAIGWSGANIRDCCELAHAMSTSLQEASKYIVPAAKQDPSGLERLYKLAEGKFLSASTEGTFQIPKAT